MVPVLFVRRCAPSEVCGARVPDRGDQCWKSDPYPDTAVRTCSFPRRDHSNTWLDERTGRPTCCSARRQLRRETRPADEQALGLVTDVPLDPRDHLVCLDLIGIVR
jgi:hypothetical protein